MHYFEIDEGGGFIKGQGPGKLTGCEDDFAPLFDLVERFFLLSISDQIVLPASETQSLSY